MSKLNEEWAIDYIEAMDRQTELNAKYTALVEAQKAEMKRLNDQIIGLEGNITNIKNHLARIIPEQGEKLLLVNGRAVRVKRDGVDNVHVDIVEVTRVK